MVLWGVFFQNFAVFRHIPNMRLRLRYGNRILPRGASTLDATEDASADTRADFFGIGAETFDGFDEDQHAEFRANDLGTEYRYMSLIWYDV